MRFFARRSVQIAFMIIAFAFSLWGVLIVLGNGQRVEVSQAPTQIAAEATSPTGWTRLGAASPTTTAPTPLGATPVLSAGWLRIEPRASGVPAATPTSSAVIATAPSATGTTTPTASTPSRTEVTPTSTEARAASVPAPPSPTLDIPTETAPPVLGQLLIEDTFSTPTGGWPVRTTNTARADYRDGRYELMLTGQRNMSVSTLLSVADYRLASDVILRQGEGGIVFLSVAPATFYHFVINTDGAYAIQVVDQATDQRRNLMDWTEHLALLRGAGAINRLQIERQNDRLVFFANDQQLEELPPPTGEVASQYGYTLNAPTGEGEAQFDNLVVEHLLK